jgi:hypothetical protein
MSLAALHRFFVDAFDSNEALLIFIEEVAPEIKPSLPGRTVERDVFAYRALEVLRARGCLDQQFFQALAQRFGRRGEEVVRLSEPFIDRTPGERTAKFAVIK